MNEEELPITSRNRTIADLHKELRAKFLKLIETKSKEVKDQ